MHELISTLNNNNKKSAGQGMIGQTSTQNLHKKKATTEHFPDEDSVMCRRKLKATILFMMMATQKHMPQACKRMTQDCIAPGCCFPHLPVHNQQGPQHATHISPLLGRCCRQRHPECSRSAPLPLHHGWSCRGFPSLPSPLGPPPPSLPLPWSHPERTVSIQ